MFTYAYTCTPQADGTFRFEETITVPNGQTVTCGDIVDKCLLFRAAAHNQHRGLRIPTVGEDAAMRAEYAATCALPDGWSASADGVNIESVDGVVSHTLRFVHVDGRDAVVPVNPDRSPIPATRTALLAVPPKE